MMPDTFVADDAVSFEEALRADANTVRARRWAGDLFASHAALRSAVWEMYAARLKECFGDEAVKIHAEAFKSIRALVDASGRDDSESLRIRFHCPAWMAQQFKARTLFPKSANDDEKKRMRAALTRQWGRAGWMPLHLLQCATGLPFFRREVVPFEVNRERKAAVYENEYTDLLLETRRRARAFRGKHTVWRYERAAREALRAYVERENFHHYAPDWRPTPKAATDSSVGEDTKEDEPTVKIESIALRAGARAAKIAAQLPAEEADACAVLFLERAVEAWETETGRVFSLVPPVIRGADKEKTSDATSRASAFGESHDSPAKDEGMTPAPQDNLSAVECLEFEPEDEPRGVSMADAEVAVEASASVGVKKMFVAFVDDTATNFEEGCTFSEYVTPSEFHEKLPAYLERNRRSPVESMTVRIRFKGDFRFVQLDDCPPATLDVLAPLSFFQAATSPGNGQSWLALADELDEAGYKELKYRLLTTGSLGKLGVNGGAHGSVRWPGSLNRKPKRRYADGESPRVQLLRAALGRVVTVAELDAAGLLGAPPVKPSDRELREIKSRIPNPSDWPDMDYYLSMCDGDRSRAESKWCVRAVSMGHPPASVEAELERIGSKARLRRHDNYIHETVENAARFVGLNPRLSPDAV
jgi:hypothetical protein